MTLKIRCLGLHYKINIKTKLPFFGKGIRECVITLMIKVKVLIKNSAP